MSGSGSNWCDQNISKALSPAVQYVVVHKIPMRLKIEYDVVTELLHELPHCRPRVHHIASTSNIVKLLEITHITWWRREHPWNVSRLHDTNSTVIAYVLRTKCFFVQIAK